MARHPRLSANDLYFHVFARGNNKQQIFFDTDTNQRFLTNLERFRELHGFKLFAYCLMPNHFHLLLKTAHVPLSKTMQVVMTAYSMYVNKKIHHVGHLFQGRFGSIIVEKETYFLEVLRYIHCNPTKAGLATLDAYLWSSYQQYLGNQKPYHPKLEISDVLAFFSNDRTKSIPEFRRFTQEGIRKDFDPVKTQVRGILGSRDFHLHLNRVLRRGRL